MTPQPQHPPPATHLRLCARGDLSEVPQAAAGVRTFLFGQGCLERDVADCELALVEACNNAMQHAGGCGSEGIEIEASCTPREIELRITDKTAGFDWPEDVSLPSPDSECGRGLFLIRSVTDRSEYRREPGRNTLVLLKVRSST